MDAIESAYERLRRIEHKPSPGGDTLPQADDEARRARELEYLYAKQTAARRAALKRLRQEEANYAEALRLDAAAIMDHVRRPDDKAAKMHMLQTQTLVEACAANVDRAREAYRRTE